MIMEHVHDPHNISAVMRSCDAVGIAEIYVIPELAEREYRFGNRSSASALKWVETHTFEDVESCYAAVREKYSQILTTHLSKDAKSIYDADLSGSLALVFGNEKYGVTEKAVELADGNLIIPQVGMIQSLNISVACAVTLYETYRQRSVKGLYDQATLTSAQEAEMFELWSNK